MYKNKNRRKITPENEISARNLQKFIKNFKTCHAPPQNTVSKHRLKTEKNFFPLPLLRILRPPARLAG